jgi:hypothetical protein
MGQICRVSKNCQKVKNLSDFSQYNLKENPFPETAVIDPLSEDIRLNGDIFYEPIFKKEIENLQRKTTQGTNVVYLAGIQFDRGIGKSALMINHMRRLKCSTECTCAYVRCNEKEKPKDVVRKVIEQWHYCGYLWEAFKIAFLAFSKAQNDLLLAPDAVESLFRANCTMPETLPLSLYTHTRDNERAATLFTNWASSNVKASSKGLAILAKEYLSSPTNFVKTIESKTIDIFDLYEACLRLLTSFRYKRHYIFLDQFEDLIMGTSKASINKFALEMKSFIRASSGLATIFVTLHPNSETSLRVPAAQDMTGVAPLDAVHRIDVMVLDTKGDSAILLAEEYFRRFRISNSPYTTYPIEPELLEFICYLQRGLIRGFLQQLHNALVFGVNNGYPELTYNYAKDHPLEILGRELDQRTIDGFNRHKGRLITENDSNRGISQLIKDFKQNESKT